MLAEMEAAANFLTFMKFKPSTLVSKGSLDRMLQEAQQAWHQKDFQKNIELLERATRLAPSNVGIHLQLGRMYGLRYDYAASERIFEKAVRISPSKTETLALVGAYARDFRNTKISELYFQRAVEQKDAKPEMLADLAELYERLRRQKDASMLIERALQSNPKSPLALLGRARLERQANHLDVAEQILRNFPTDAHYLLYARALYELGGVLDRQSRYDEAMGVFIKAKEILKSDAARFDAGLKTVHYNLKILTENLKPEMLQHWFDSGSDFQPPHRLTLLGGHPRSGTTLIEQVLDAHPDVISAEETEIFVDDTYSQLARNAPSGTLMLSVLQAAQTNALKNARDSYFRSMELALGKSIGSRMLIDKNPSLTFLIPALVRVFPEIKLLIALRDPRDVVLSCFMQPFFQIGQTNSAYLSLEGTVEEYTTVMNVWRAVKPLLKNPWQEIRYEDMVDDLESVARKSLNFLGVLWDAKVLGFDEHARNKTVRSPTYADVTKPVYKSAIGRWHHYRKHLEPYLHKLEPFIKEFGYE